VNSLTLSPDEVERFALRKWLGEVVGPCYAARSTENPWQYAERKVYLDAKAAAEPGFYNSALTPYTRRMQEIGTAPAIDPLTGGFVHTYVCMKSSRSGFTEGVLNIIRWMPENQPGHALYAIDSKDEVKAISKERLRPTLERILGEAQLPDDPDDMGTFKMFLRNMTILLSGSYAEGVFSNKWLRKAFLDECEVLSQDVGGSTPIDLVESRGTTVDDFQKFLLSKPKLPDTRFHQEYLAGTQEKVFVPCPHCGHRQELVWDNVRFDHCKELDGRWNKRRVVTETYYRCAGEKRCRIEYELQRGMVALGEWRIMNPDFTPGIVSQQISDLYSPFEKVCWGKLALIWLGSQNSIVKIQHFFNNHLGLPYVASQTSITESDLLACRSGRVDESGKRDGEVYNFGELPWRPHRMLAVSDVQGDEFKWEMWAFRGLVRNYGEETQVVQIETALIDYGKAIAFDDLSALLDKAYLVRRGDGVPCFAAEGLVDSGYNTYAVYDFCQLDPRWYPTKGVGATSGKMVVEKLMPHKGGDDVLCYQYEDFSIKVEFYEGRIKRRREPRLYWPTDFGEEKHAELREELLSERLIVTGAKKEWKAKCNGAPNDWGDGGKMGAVVGLTLLQGAIEEAALMEMAELMASRKK
jgi:phage terminase large subunit GpA-like protein